MHDRHIDDEVRRWARAMDRVQREHIRVLVLPGTDEWLATGSQPGVVYELEVVGNLVVRCSCPAGQQGDPVCKHKAAAYRLMGVELQEVAR